MTTLDLAAAAAFLGLHPDTLADRARAGIIPGAKIGKEWRFLPADLEAYFRSKYRCPSISAPAAQTGGSTSGILAADALDDLLERATGRKPSANTTNLRLVSGTKRKPGGNSPTPSSRGRRRKTAGAAT